MDGQKRSDFFECEPELLRLTDESHLGEIRVAIRTIPG